MDHFSLAQHLAHDNLDVLVIDRNALQPIDLLNLVDDVLRKLRDALEPKNVVRTRGTFGHDLAPFHMLAVEHRDLPPFRNQRLYRFAFGGGDDESAFPFRLLAEAYGSHAFRQDGGFLWFACFEQIRNPR